MGNPISRTDGKYPPTAPFRIIDGATIKNLTVDGTIVSSLKYNAGFVGFAFGNKTGNANNIKNCTSNIVINCRYITNSPGDDGANYKQWDCSSAGFVAENKRVNGVESKLHFENCIFYGSIIQGRDEYQLGNENANRGAGFVSYSGPTTNKVLFNNCLMMGHIELQPLPNSSSLSTFSRPKDYITYEGTCYYANNYGNVPQTNCRLASDILEEEVSKKFTVDGEDYYVPVQITELHSMEYTSPEPLNVEVSFYGKSLVKDTDYTIVILKKDNDGVYQPATEIVGPRGAYKVTVTGKNDRGYYGESVYEFEFINEDEKWEKLVKFIDDADDGGTITLPNDFYAMDGNNALEINKNLTINLSGHQIHRNLTEPVVKGQVLRIASGKTVTINGPGTITGGYNIAESDTENGANNDGGGIYNKGILILNNVTVTHNKCIKLHEGTNAYTARGGGIFNGTGSSFSMTNGVVSHNIARGGGGGVYCEAPTSFSMTNVSISSNESESKGGGLRIRTSGNVEAALTGCTIDHNHSTATGSNRASEGGGIYMQEGHLRMENCIITYNQSAFAGAGFYTMTKEGVWQSKTDADEIKVCQGILVKALKSGTITMENKEGKASKASNDQIMFSVFNSKFEDHAYAVFDKGHGLDKISHFNDKAPMVYIRQNNDDYAIAMFEKRKTFNLCFKAMTTGRYTLSVKPEGNISYLHIIDRLTGEDIDMLKEHEYSFVASITDNDSRFIVRVSENDDAEESFVYQNGNDIIVTGNGELQIFDMVGRLVNKQYVNGIGIVRKPSHSGVYIFRLVGETTRAQKIFVE